MLFVMYTLHIIIVIMRYTMYVDSINDAVSISSQAIRRTKDDSKTDIEHASVYTHYSPPLGGKLQTICM